MSEPRRYAIKEIYPTLQGEGAQAGQMAVFLRFAGCNLWTGREDDRPGATCVFCDTDFVGTNGPGGGSYDEQALVRAVNEAWVATGASGPRRWVVCTGGEPTLQLDSALVRALQQAGFRVAIETNGTRPVPEDVDWVCVSPKADAPLVQTSGHELKLVYPQADAQPERFKGLAFDHFFLQPMDGPDKAAATDAAIAYCMAHPEWRLSLQTHKLVGLR
ncbi:MAG: 7-carboxy-7-deazaguanine synthase [Candidatus Sericytochromatia bacterium]|nr:7-carboxy-7-deazaguanine synthase [Candidatus Tanganyikabacteria bacterium]